MNAADTTPRDARARGLLVLLLALSVIGLGVRFYAARVVGFGDSEALYASYAFFPQPAYVDHPGLIGIVASWLGDGAPPSPLVAHTLTSFAATLAPWAVVLACRALRSDLRGALGAGVAVAVVPEISVGLFGMTPDLPLFYAWVATLALFGRALLERPGSTRAAVLFLFAGLSVGIASASKVTGLVLGLALVVTLLQGAREHARTAWPWAGLALAAVVVSPVVVFERHMGWPMLHHRFVETQAAAGVSLRNASAILVGQLGYVSPLLCVVGVVLARELLRTRAQDTTRALLASATFVPLLVLVPLCLWSRVAEPHWLAPAWMALPLYFAHRSSEERPSRVMGRSSRAAVWVGFACTALVYAWVLVPGLVSLVPARAYDARLDIANELYGWPDAIREVRHTVTRARFPTSEPSDVAVVGPVWMVSAQLRAALPASTPVGCAGVDCADFETWAPRRAWGMAEIVVFVHDNRTSPDEAALFPDRVLIESHTKTVTRGGRVARVFTIDVLGRRAAG